MEEYRRARRIVVEQAFARTQQNAALAVSVLMKLMVDSSTPASGRIRAALGLFSLARQGLDVGGENRVSPLERGKRIIIPSLRDASDEELAALLASSNRKVRDRVNCVNAKLCSLAGIRTLCIDPRCKQLIQDLERVQWKQDANGNMLYEIDKSDPARTHVSDALGYKIKRSRDATGGWIPVRVGSVRGDDCGSGW